MSDYGLDELQYRWFFHLTLEGRPRESWRHGELAEDGSVLIPFDFFWADLSALPASRCRLPRSTAIDTGRLRAYSAAAAGPWPKRPPAGVERRPRLHVPPKVDH